MPLQSPGLLTASEKEQRFWDWMAACLIWWSAAQEHHRGLFSPHSSLYCTPETYSTTQSGVICRNTQMTLQLWSVSRDWVQRTGGPLCGIGGNNHHISNVNKTNETIVDFRRTRSRLNNISIKGEEVETASGNLSCTQLQLMTLWRNLNNDSYCNR